MYFKFPKYQIVPLSYDVDEQQSIYTKLRNIGLDQSFYNFEDLIVHSYSAVCVKSHSFNLMSQNQILLVEVELLSYL